MIREELLDELDDLSLEFIEFDEFDRLRDRSSTSDATSGRARVIKSASMVGDVALLLTDDNAVVRVPKSRKEPILHFRLEGKKYGFHKVFTDPTGTHSLLSFENGHLYYLNHLDAKGDSAAAGDDGGDDEDGDEAGGGVGASGGRGGAGRSRVSISISHVAMEKLPSLRFCKLEDHHKRKEQQKGTKGKRGKETFVVESVAWDTTNSTEDCTGLIVLGGTEGQLVQAVVTYDFCKHAATDEFELLDTITAGTPVSDVFQMTFPVEDQELDSAGSASAPGAWRGACRSPVVRYLMAATEAGVYQFYCPATELTYLPLFQSGAPYEKLPRPVFGLPNAFPRAFACARRLEPWLTSRHPAAKPRRTFGYFARLVGEGSNHVVAHGPLDFDLRWPESSLPTSSFHSESVVRPATGQVDVLQRAFVDNGRLELPDDYGPPLDVATTVYHVLVLYPTHVVAFNKLDPSRSYAVELMFGSNTGEVQCFLRDAKTDSVWVLSENSMFKVVLLDEEKDMPDVLSALRIYEPAAALCKSREAREKVYEAQAEFNFAKRLFTVAGACFAKTSLPFEAVALRLFHAGSMTGLKRYLSAKVSKLAEQEVPALERCYALGAWYVELVLSELARMRGVTACHCKRLPALSSQPASARYTRGATFMQKGNVRFAGGDDDDDDGDMSEYDEDDLEMLREELMEFIEDHLEVIDRDATLEIMQAYSDNECLLRFREILEDYEWIIRHYLRVGDFGALLERFGDRSTPITLVQEYSAELLSAFASQFGSVQRIAGILFQEVWLDRLDELDPVTLLPALMRYELHYTPQDGTNHAIAFLEECVEDNCGGEKVFNYLVYLYARLDEEGPLLSFIEANRVDYDLRYALRVAHQHGKLYACVQIYALLELYEQAIDLCLNELDDPDLAKDLLTDNAPYLPRAKAMRLWLRISRSIFESDQEEGLANAMELVRGNVLTLEDVLPLIAELGDRARLADIEKQTCFSLEAYNRERGKHLEHGNHVDKTRDDIRRTLRQLEVAQADNADCLMCNSDQPCDVCGQPVFARRFLIFPCLHAFHTDCASREIEELMTENPDVAREIYEELNAAAQAKRQAVAAGEVQTAGIDDLHGAEEYLDAVFLAESLGAAGREMATSSFSSKGKQQRASVLGMTLDKETLAKLECPFCGRLAIARTALPLVDKERLQREIELWAI